MYGFRFWIAALWGCIAFSADVVSAQTLSVAAASDLQSALPAIAASFEQSTGYKVAVTFGSSGNFFAQIQNGAPFDVFLSADIDYPRRLERAGLTEPGTFVEYATGKLVLWTRTGTGLELKRGLSALTDPKVQHIAVANPEHAPYGRAAVAALRHEKLYEALRPKFVLGENISQAAQFAESGSAEAGLLALSLALSPALARSGSYAAIPDASYPPIEQAAVVLASSKQKAIGRRFLDTLRKPETIKILQTYGFGVPMATR